MRPLFLFRSRRAGETWSLARAPRESLRLAVPEGPSWDRGRCALAWLAVVRADSISRLEQLKEAPKAGPNLMVLILVRVIGIGIETADMLVREILSRNLRD